MRANIILADRQTRYVTAMVAANAAEIPATTTTSDSDCFTSEVMPKILCGRQGTVAAFRLTASAPSGVLMFAKLIYVVIFAKIALQRLNALSMASAAFMLFLMTSAWAIP
jgi:hypothetical protein